MFGLASGVVYMHANEAIAQPFVQAEHDLHNPCGRAFRSRFMSVNTRRHRFHIINNNNGEHNASGCQLESEAALTWILYAMQPIGINTCPFGVSSIFPVSRCFCGCLRRRHPQKHRETGKIRSTVVVVTLCSPHHSPYSLETLGICRFRRCGRASCSGHMIEFQHSTPHSAALTTATTTTFAQPNRRSSSGQSVIRPRHFLRRNATTSANCHTVL